jgi:rhamnose transport system permease protein
MIRVLRSREGVLALVIAALVGAISLRAPGFLAWDSIDGMLTDGAILAMLALAQMAVILTRGIDLSVAASLALSGMIAALLAQAHPDLPLVLPILAAVGTGLGLGLVNGGLIAFLEIPPIVVTLGTLSAYRGLIFVASGGTWISSQDMPPAFLAFPQGRFLGLTHLVWLAAVLAVAAAVLLTRTARGRALYALGGNPRAARTVGVEAAPHQLLVYAVSGAVSGLAGYLWVARYAIAYTEIALGFELQVIAACVIGGVSIAGGIGTVTGCLLGAAFLTVLNNALPVIHVSPFWQMALSGIVILAAVVINAGGDSRGGKLILRPGTRGTAVGEGRP